MVKLGQVDPPAQAAARLRVESGSKATDTEVLFIFILLAARAQEALLLEGWLQTVLLEEYAYKVSRTCAQTADCWAAPSADEWGSKGRVHTLLADSLTQEACFVQAAAEVMHDGINHAGHLAVVLPTSLLQRYIGKLKTKRVLLGVKRA
eukprot:6184217-Pleurochrysis_carterae.AAC.1